MNNLIKCERETKQSMDLPFDGNKMLTFVGWMITRGLKGYSMSSYISALRMYHIAMGYNEPVLREPIVKLILKGQSNWEMVRKKLDGVGPVDNRPSTDKHHNFVRKKNNVTGDM